MLDTSANMSQRGEMCWKKGAMDSIRFDNSASQTMSNDGNE